MHERPLTLLERDFGSWPTVVITKSMHSCLRLTHLGNVIPEESEVLS